MDKEITTEILDILLEYEPHETQKLMEQVVMQMDDDHLEGFRAKLKNYWIWEGSFSGEHLLKAMENEREKREKEKKFSASNPSTIISGNTISNIASNTIPYTLSFDSDVVCKYDYFTGNIEFGGKAINSIIRDVSDALTQGFLPSTGSTYTGSEAQNAHSKLGNKIRNDSSMHVSGDIASGIFDLEIEQALERIKTKRPDLFI